MSASRKLILAWVTVMAAASAAVASNGDGPSVRDEWAPVDRVVLSPDLTAGIITPWGKTIIQEALKNAVKPVIFDGDAAKQQIILQDLKNAGVIQKDSDVHIFNNPLPGGWPRDYAPMTVFKGHTKGAALTGSVFESEAKTNTIVQNTATALSMTGINVPQVKFPTGYDPPQLPFSLDGGDWMTTNGGKRLVTTTNIYEQNGDGTGQMLQDVTKDDGIKISPLPRGLKGLHIRCPNPVEVALGLPGDLWIPLDPDHLPGTSLLESFPHETCRASHVEHSAPDKPILLELKLPKIDFLHPS